MTSLTKTQPPCSDTPWFVAQIGQALGGGNTPTEALEKAQARAKQLTQPFPRHK